MELLYPPCFQLGLVRLQLHKTVSSLIFAGGRVLFVPESLSHRKTNSCSHSRSTECLLVIVCEVPSGHNPPTERQKSPSPQTDGEGG